MIENELIWNNTILGQRTRAGAPLIQHSQPAAHSGYLCAQLNSGEDREERKESQLRRGAWWVHCGLSFGNVWHIPKLPD